MAISTKYTDDELIERYLVPATDTSSPAKWRVQEEERAVPVWALIAVMAEDGSNAEQVAHSYGISLEAMAAAQAYYRRNKRFIDAWNLLNSVE